MPVHTCMCVIQVPSRNGMNAEDSLRMFSEDLPALGVLGTPHVILSDMPYEVDEEVQLVCKYLKAYRIGGTKGIDRLYKEGMSVHRACAYCVMFLLPIVVYMYMYVVVV